MSAKKEYNKNDSINNLTIIKELDKHVCKGGQTKRVFLFKCFCGNNFEAMIESVKRKYTRSCGCLRKKTSSCLNKKHGLSNHRLFIIWTGIMARTSSEYYKEYKGRGISVCDEWKKDFINFYKWSMDNGYSHNLSIDRIDNDGNYEPSNCRWANFSTQMRNRRLIHSNNTSGYKGVHRYKNKWQSRIRNNNKNIHLGTFDNKNEAALARNNYIIEHGLEYPLNIIV